MAEHPEGRRRKALNLLRGLPRLPGFVVRKTGSALRLGGRALRWTAKGFGLASRAALRWLSCDWLLFSSSSRRLFTQRTTPLALLVLAAWLVYTLQKFPERFGEAALEPALTYVFPLAIVFAIFFSMNIVPRENESRTVEVFFSLPVRRYRLVIWHLATVAVWLLLLLLFQAGALRLMNPQVPLGALFLRTYPSLVCISCLTVYISTLTRNGPAAGLIAGLVCFSHLYRIYSFGPVRLFQSPFLSGPPGASAWGMPQVVLLAVLCILLITQINQRLKKSELWLR